MKNVSTTNRAQTNVAEHETSRMFASPYGLQDPSTPLEKAPACQLGMQKPRVITLWATCVLGYVLA